MLASLGPSAGNSGNSNARPSLNPTRKIRWWCQRPAKGSPDIGVYSGVLERCEHLNGPQEF